MDEGGGGGGEGDGSGGGGWQGRRGGRRGAGGGERGRGCSLPFAAVMAVGGCYVFGKSAEGFEELGQEAAHLVGPRRPREGEGVVIHLSPAPRHPHRRRALASPGLRALPADQH